MLNFTEHMKRIIQLSEQCLVHVQEERYEPAANNLLSISINANEAMGQLDELSLKNHQGKTDTEAYSP